MSLRGKKVEVFNNQFEAKNECKCKKSSGGAKEVSSIYQAMIKKGKKKTGRNKKIIDKKVLRC